MGRLASLHHSLNLFPKPAAVNGLPKSVTRPGDDSVLSLVLAEAETHPNAEERRLFYVALTRARVGVYLLTDNPQSSFLNELRGQPGVDEIPTPR